MKKMLLIGVLLMTTLLMAPTLAEAETKTWVVMRGRVEKYGDNPAFGWCGAHAKIGEWARAFVAWIPWSGPQIPEIINFHAARLVNTTLVELDGSLNLYIEGYWNVYNVTFIHGPYKPGMPGNFTLIIKPWVVHGWGTLSVTGVWPKNFTVDITGINPIRGVVIFYVIRSVEFPPCDVYGPNGTPDYAVNIWDLEHIAHAYGSTCIMAYRDQWVLDFDFSRDFDFDYKVGLCELTTVAANLGIVY